MTAAVRPIERITGGDHACLVFDSEAERRSRLARFVRGALGAREKVLYLADAASPDARSVGIEAADFDATGFVESGQLLVRNASEVYLADGSFDPDLMIDRLREEIAAASRQGWDGFRVTGEMSWALRGARGSERLPEYEERVQEVFDGSGAAGVCQYDCRRFAAAEINAVRRAHRVVIGGWPRRVLWREPLTVDFLRPARARAAGEIDLIAHERFAECLFRLEREESDATLDLSDLSFIDVPGIRMLDACRARFARRGLSLTLVSPPAVVTRVLGLVWGRDDAGAGLRVEDPRRDDPRVA